MDRKNIGITIGAGIICFLIGFLLRGASSSGAQDPQAPVQTMVQNPVADHSGAGGGIDVNLLQFRVDDGEVQWFDGDRWNTVGSVEELTAQDKFLAAAEKLDAFEKQYTEQQDTISFGPGENQVLTGEKKKDPDPKKDTPPKEPKPSANPKPAPVEVKPPAGSDNGNSGGSSAGSDNSSSGGGSSAGSDNGSSGGGSSAGSDNGNSGGGSSAGNNNSGDTVIVDSGDGEDMSNNWSDWFE